jgi:hypothetical protein
MNEESQSVSSENSGVVKRGRGRPAGSVSNKPPASPKTKSCRIPVELLPTIDNLLKIHKDNSRDGRSKRGTPGAQQKRVSSKTEVREIPLQFLPVVVEMVAAWRTDHGMTRTRRKRDES